MAIEIKSRKQGKIEIVVEKCIWSFRLVIMLGVVGLLLSSTIMFLTGAIETGGLIVKFVSHLLHNGLHIDTQTLNEITIYIILIIDDFLLGIVLLIFGLGTYDLFISKIEIAYQAFDQDHMRRPDWLQFKSLDELKSILGKVVLMILIINFLKFVLNTEFKKPLDLLYLGGSILFIALALKFSHGHDINKTAAKDHIEKS